MKIYNYHPDSKEYLGDSLADESPLEQGVNFIPAFATKIKPPEVETKQVAVFENNEWIIKPDFRGRTFYDKTSRQAVLINFIGDIPDNLQETEPEKSLNEIKEELKQIITNKKKSIAYGGYKFTKNESEYIFSTSKEDLSLVLSTVMAFNNNAIITINWKCNNNKFVELAKDEFLNLYMQGTAFINEQFNKEKTFIEELESQTELSTEWIANFKQRIEEW